MKVFDNGHIDSSGSVCLEPFLLLATAGVIAFVKHAFKDLFLADLLVYEPPKSNLKFVYQAEEIGLHLPAIEVHDGYEAG
jgi:hypothetical protein